MRTLPTEDWQTMWGKFKFKSAAVAYEEWLIHADVRGDMRALPPDSWQPIYGTFPANPFDADFDPYSGAEDSPPASPTGRKKKRQPSMYLNKPGYPPYHRQQALLKKKAEKEAAKKAEEEEAARQAANREARIKTSN